MIPMNRRRFCLIGAGCVLSMAQLSARNLATPTAETYPDKSNLMLYRDSSGSLQPVKSKRQWIKRRQDILAAMQEVMGSLPGRGRQVPLDVRIVESIDCGKYTRHKITFAVERGDRVPAWLLVPNARKGRLPAMLCLHQTTAIGKGEPAGLGGLANLHYAQELAERGYVTLAPDYPNFGDYKVDAYAMGYASATMKGIWNHMRAVDLLASRPEVDRRRIGCIGHSLGGHNSLFVSVFDERIKVVVTSCGFNSFYHYKKGDLTGWSHKGYMPRIADRHGKNAQNMPFDFTEIIGAIAPRPLFINAPTRDSNFLTGIDECVSTAMPVYALHGKPGNLVVMHPDSEHDFPTGTREAAYQFMDRALK